MVAANNRGGENVTYNEQWRFILYRLFLLVWLFLGLPFASHLLDLWKGQVERFFNFIERQTAPYCCMDQNLGNPTLNDDDCNHGHCTTDEEIMMSDRHRVGPSQ